VKVGIGPVTVKAAALEEAAEAGPEYGGADPPYDD
jgi:hypothetical protein